MPPLVPAGGRGLGTMLNFQGRGGGSPAEVHGRRITGLCPAAVLDGCAMIFRRSALREIKFQPDFPPHHFYDRFLSCQMLERGWRLAVQGVACDHLSGQTADHEPSYDALAQRWAAARGLLALEGNWDLTVYREGERQFLKTWRDEKKFIPLTVGNDWKIRR